MERLNVYVTTPELIQFTASLFTSIPGRIILAYYLFVPIVPYDGAKLVSIIVSNNAHAELISGFQGFHQVA